MAKNSKPPAESVTEATDEQPEEKPETPDIDRLANTIFTSRIKREMAPVLSQISALTEAIAKLTAPKQPEEGGEGEESEAPKSKEDPKILKKMTKLERELAEERDARKKAEQAQRDEHAQRQRQEMLSIYDSALAEHGVNDPQLRRAALVVLEQDGNMVRDDETGKVRFKGVDKFGIETLFEPKVGLRQWVTTEGKSFVPAVDTGGSGSGGAREGSLSNTKLSRGEYSRLNKVQKASIDLERALQGLPPLDE